MPYSKDFFALQLTDARKLAERFKRDLDDTLFNYTTFSRSIESTPEDRSISRILFGRHMPKDYIQQ